MTSERDTRVSETYREAATAKAPEHLDRAILDEARRAARPAYARSRAWTRPLAWAATIVLSVTIVLELTQVDDPVDQPAGSLSQDTEAPAEPARRKSAADAPITMLEEEVPADESGLANGFVQTEAPASTPVPATGRSAPAKTEDAQESRLRKAPVSLPEATAEDFELQDKDLLRRADEAARLQHSEDKAGANVEADPALGSTAFLAEAPPPCPEEATRDPGSWLACIEELEAAGHDEAAAEQRRLLKEAFPDFELP
ncbi:MAG: hypothetical protein GWN47_04100 [Woeseiaceae bacterium]|nr:hypothetical protein [Woeseiaceae bacterium]